LIISAEPLVQAASPRPSKEFAGFGSFVRLQAIASQTIPVMR
jgi:hypothetical protein